MQTAYRSPFPNSIDDEEDQTYPWNSRLMMQRRQTEPMPPAPRVPAPMSSFDEAPPRMGQGGIALPPMPEYSVEEDQATFSLPPMPTQSLAPPTLPMEGEPEPVSIAPPIMPGMKAPDMDQLEASEQGQAGGETMRPSTPALDSLNAQVERYRVAADKKVPLWRQIAGAALTASPRLAHAGQMLATNQEAERIGNTLPAYQSAANIERQNRAELSNEAARLDALATNAAYRKSQAENQRVANEDRRIRMMLDPNLEEIQPGEAYRGTVDVGGKKMGVIRPEVVAKRTAEAKKSAERETWLDVPKPLQEKYGLGPKAPHQTIDNSIRLIEAEGRAQEASALRRELAQNQEQMRRELAAQSDKTSRDNAALAAQTSRANAELGATTRKEVAEAAQANKPPSSAERRAENFHIRAVDANKDLESMEQEMANKGFFGQLGYSYLPNFAQSDLNQAYHQAQRAFTEARLRKDSGAAIPPHEFVSDAKTYFPQPGDSKSTLAQKRRSRETLIRALQQEAGRAVEQNKPTGTDGSQDAAAPPAVGTVQEGYRFKGGNPADKNNWEKAR
jgi:hypothetical protein